MDEINDQLVPSPMFICICGHKAQQSRFFTACMNSVCQEWEPCVSPQTKTSNRCPAVTVSWNWQHLIWVASHLLNLCADRFNFLVFPFAQTASLLCSHNRSGVILDVASLPPLPSHLRPWQEGRGALIGAMAAPRALCHRWLIQQSTLLRRRGRVERLKGNCPVWINA